MNDKNLLFTGSQNTQLSHTSHVQYLLPPKSRITQPHYLIEHFMFNVNAQLGKVCCHSTVPCTHPTVTVHTRSTCCLTAPHAHARNTSAHVPCMHTPGTPSICPACTRHRYCCLTAVHAHARGTFRLFWMHTRGPPAVCRACTCYRDSFCQTVSLSACLPYMHTQRVYVAYMDTTWAPNVCFPCMYMTRAAATCRKCMHNLGAPAVRLLCKITEMRCRL